MIFKGMMREQENLYQSKTWNDFLMSLMDDDELAACEEEKKKEFPFGLCFKNPLVPEHEVLDELEKRLYKMAGDKDIFLKKTGLAISMARARISRNATKEQLSCAGVYFAEEFQDLFPEAFKHKTAGVYKKGLDCFYEGLSFDLKYSRRYRGWAIPPENFGCLILGVNIDYKTNIFKVGIFQAKEEFLRKKGGRDKKRTLISVKEDEVDVVRWLGEGEIELLDWSDVYLAMNRCIRSNMKNEKMKAELCFAIQEIQKRHSQ